jgi:hypothetical protein
MVGTVIGPTTLEEKIDFVASVPARAPANSAATPVAFALPKFSGGAHNVYLYFWSDPSADVHISAGLSADHLAVFRTRSCQAAEASQFAQPVEVAEGNRLLYRAYLGRIADDPNASPAIYSIDSNEAPAIAGLGYQKAE